MKIFLLASVALASAMSAAGAADMPPPRPVPQPPAWSWEGLYIGVHSGALWSGAQFSNPFGASMYGDLVDVPGYLTGAQIGFNWMVAPGWVAGIEADASFVSSDGSNTCLQFARDFIGSNCRVNTRGMGTFTGRLGVTAGPAGRTLLYGKGGLAWISNQMALQVNHLPEGASFPQGATGTTYTQWGWTIGAGVEQALTAAWSLKLEYDYLRFADKDVTTPASIVVNPGNGSIAQVIAAASSTVRQDAHLFKLGLNYKWGADPWSAWSAPWAAWAPASAATAAVPVKGIYKGPPPASPAWAAGWELEVGGRYWLSTGRFQWDNFASPDVAISRLTYSRMVGHSGELFGRVDTPLNVFVKGFIGGGSITRGQMNDEDWGLTDPGFVTGYTNTLSDPVKGPIGYATADIGFDALRGPGYKAGPFVGYNYFREVLNAYGCAQTANPAAGICTPSVPATVLVITQTAKWQSLRIGYAADTMLTESVKIGGDVAYLPYVAFDGRDDHWLRDTRTFFDQRSRNGRGVQAELLVSYLVTPSFSLGVGGRYWAMWTQQGEFTCTGCPGGAAPPNPSKNTTERYGVFFQGAYRFDSPVVVTAKN